MRLKRAYSPTDILNMNIPSLDFTGDWEASLGKPAKTGTWIIWGSPGNGKTSFVMQLAKYLCRFDKVIYDSLEESTGLSVQKSLQRHQMQEVSRRFLILDREPMEQLSERLSKRKSPGIVIIDSFQYSGLSYASYRALKEKHSNKLLIFVSHAEGQRPEGRAAKKVEYDADVKILTVNGQLVAQGRSNGGSFTWNGRDSGGKRVASGIYMVATAKSDGTKGTVCKIAIIR